jgi:hypothetical protein
MAFCPPRDFTMVTIRAIIAAIVITQVMACAPASRPGAQTRASPARTPEHDTKMIVLVRRDYGNRGEFIVELHETAAGTNGRNLEYVFLLNPHDGGATRRLMSFDVYDATPVGNAYQNSTLIAASLTSDPAVVDVFRTTMEYDGKVNGSVIYEAHVTPIDISGFEGASSARQEVYAPEETEPDRRASVTGSLKENTLTLSLEGPKDTLQFRFELSARHFGWYPVPPAPNLPGVPR